MHRHATRKDKGFTLLEVLIAVLIMSLISSLVLMSFHQIVKATRKTRALVDKLHHGDFVMDQMVLALQSAAWFRNAPDKYGFWLEDEEGEHPSDIVSWVTSSSAFMPPQLELRHGLHRIFVSIEDDKDGKPALAVSAYPHLVDPDDDEVDEIEPWIISRRVKGIDVRPYLEWEEDFGDEWEKENQIPTYVELTLFVEPPDAERGEIIEMTRLVRIPMGILARGKGPAEPDVDEEDSSEESTSENTGNRGGTSPGNSNTAGNSGAATPSPGGGSGGGR